MPTLTPLRRFLETIRSRHTRRAYRTDLRDFFNWQEEEGTTMNQQIDNVEKTDVRDYVRSLRDEGASESTRRRRLSALRRFYDWAMDQGLVDTNPARDARIDVSPTSRQAEDASGDPSVLSKSEVETLIRATGEAGEAATRDRGLLLTILYAALRRSEVAAMNVSHVRPLGRHWVIDLPSGDTWSSAYVKVPEAVVEAIDSVQARYGIDEGALWRSLSNRNRGARMTPDGIYKMVCRTGQRADLDGVTVDTLRQTSLRLALEAGATLQEVQRHSRLQSVSSVERYAQTDEQTDRLSESPVDLLNLDLSE